MQSLFALQGRDKPQESLTTEAAAAPAGAAVLLCCCAVCRFQPHNSLARPLLRASQQVRLREITMPHHSSVSRITMRTCKSARHLVRQ